MTKHAHITIAAISASLLIAGAARAGLGANDGQAGGSGAFDQRPCHSDMNGDDHVGFFELNMLLVQWGACPTQSTRPDLGAAQATSNGCAADLDGDGFVGFVDLNVLITTWGDCAVVVQP